MKAPRAGPSSLLYHRLECRHLENSRVVSNCPDNLRPDCPDKAITSGANDIDGTSGEREWNERQALSLDPTSSNTSRPASPSHRAAAVTARHQAMRASRVAFASCNSRSPWHGNGAHQVLLVNDVINVAAQGVMSMTIIYSKRDRNALAAELPQCTKSAVWATSSCAAVAAYDPFPPSTATVPPQCSA
jgi:hypothetical protein